MGVNKGYRISGGTFRFGNQIMEFLYIKLALCYLLTTLNDVNVHITIKLNAFAVFAFLSVRKCYLARADCVKAQNAICPI